MPRKRSSSSRNWLKEHFNDFYVKQAQQEGYRSRAVYKLAELQERYQLFKPGMTVVDLGAAPGGWAQYAIEKIKPKGHVIAIDILPMESLPGVEFIQGDFTDNQVLQELLNRLPDKKVDWVLSDMSPNISGIDSVDQPRSIYLAELALDLAIQVLNKQGGFLVKVFQGEGFDAYLALIRQYFTQIRLRKPKASRGRSREIYILASTKK
jgi:23S rRNA (uridine2552-2'-O)-methyltransferase